jgi:hypothetical protein
MCLFSDIFRQMYDKINEKKQYIFAQYNISLYF